MNVKPILFSTDMVRAIQENRKTVTRRVVKPQPEIDEFIYRNQECGEMFISQDNDCFPEIKLKPPYCPGDIMYVRETWTSLVGSYLYKADQKPGMKNPGKWHPSIHMPREAARIFLRVTDVRVERLQDMSREDAVLEGCDPTLKDIAPDLGYYRIWTEMESLWNRAIKPADRAIYGWDANPWVWVNEFERCEKPKEVDIS